MLRATFSLPPDALGLEQTLQRVPGIDLHAERIAAHSTEWTMPCLWVANVDSDDVDEALRDDPTVDEIVETYEYGEETYYQLVWSENVVDRIDAYLDRAGSILEAAAGPEGWRVQIRFASRDQFDDFCDTVSEDGHSYELLELVEPGAPRQSGGQVTAKQRDALVAAMEHGYYMIPREISATDLAAKLDISQQALSERLRRGTENLVNSRLRTADEPGEA